nr:MAG: hypothetical protein [Skomarfal virus 49]
MSGQSTRWVFTLNNPTEDETLSSLPQCASYLVFGKEVGASGTPHLQGFIIFSERKRLRSVRQVVGARAHCEVAKGSSQQARDYCCKDGVFFEYGVCPSSDQGRRSDLDSFFLWATEFHGLHGRAPSPADICNFHPVVFTKFPRVVECIRLRLPPPRLVPDQVELRGWQAELFAELQELPDDRSIRFIVDPEGGKGKTFFQKYCLCSLEGVQIMATGKRDDLAFIIDETKRIFLFNVPRGGLQFLSYVLLEQLKDRMVFSPKYESRVKILQVVPHVYVFTNEDPDRTKLTLDRFRTKYITN